HAELFARIWRLKGIDSEPVVAVNSHGQRAGGQVKDGKSLDCVAIIVGAVVRKAGSVLDGVVREAAFSAAVPIIDSIGLVEIGIPIDVVGKDRGVSRVRAVEAG